MAKLPTYSSGSNFAGIESLLRTQTDAQNSAKCDFLPAGRVGILDLAFARATDDDEHKSYILRVVGPNLGSPFIGCKVPLNSLLFRTSDRNTEKSLHEKT